MSYPWYGLSSTSDSPQQGDLLQNVPILTANEVLSSPDSHIVPKIETYDMVVLSQSCDLGNNGKLSQVQLAPVYTLKEFMTKNTHLNTTERLEDLRKNHMPRYYLMNRNTSTKFKKDFLIVDFGKVHTIKLKSLKALCDAQPRRLRLLSPYREQLSQHYARFFMRVGLPEDIPVFTQVIRTN